MSHDAILRGVEESGTSQERLAPFDAVIIPGGGLFEDGSVPPWVINRLDKAMELAQGAHIITLSAGTPHKPPPLDGAGNPILECVAEAAYLRESGYPPELLLMENASYDTIGNAYFARVMHVDPAGLRRLCVVTSQFHMARMEAVFRWVFGLAPARCVYDLAFTAVPNVGMSREVLDARRRKEELSLNNLAALQAAHTTLASFHQWLFSKHAAYAVEKPHREKADSLLLQTY
jgi:hypothetical protein